MRKVNKVIIHCSATPPTMAIDAETVRGWHVDGNGWKDIGYHFFIKRDGTIEVGRSIKVAGAHTKGHNGGSIGICYAGGVAVDRKTPEDNRTDAQKEALTLLCKALSEVFPKVTFHGHNEFSAKACPSFDVAEEKYGTFCMRSPEKLIEVIKSLCE